MWKNALTVLLLAGLWSGPGGGSPALAEDARTIGTTELVTPSRDTPLKPGQWIEGTDFERVQRPYTIQRLTDRVYWVEVAGYESTVLVGDQGVMVIDAPCCGRVPAYLAAIRELTDLPVTTLVYSHYHLDHVAGANEYLSDAESAGRSLSIVANSSTSAQIEKFGNKIPPPTEIVSVPRGTFEFEGRKVVMGTPPSGHTVDNSWILLEEDRVLHSVDLVHPGVLEFMNFGVAEDLDGYEKSVRELLTLEWDFLCAGHSNVGNQADVQLVLDYLADIRRYTGQAMASTEFQPFVQEGTIFYEWIAGFRDAVIDKTVSLMQPRWAQYTGFDVVIRSHAERMFFETYLH